MVGKSLSVRRAFTGFVALSLLVVAIQAGCGDSSGSSFGNGGGSSGTSGDFTGPGFGGGDGEGGASSGDPNVAGLLDVTPAEATITVTIIDGVVAAAPQAFVATFGGVPVNATWLFDRGELGDVDAAGVFTANGKNVGEGTVTARFGAREGSAKVKVVIHATQNGAPVGVDAGGGGFGGIGGVGGDPLGPAVAGDTVTKLKTESSAAAGAQLEFLYPYDKTVWPKGLLAPLLMWNTSKEGGAVYVKLSQSNYSFEGTYSVAQLAAAPSSARKRVRIQDDAWQTATSGNQGDDLTLEVKVYVPSENKVYGPITRTWKVAPGILRGTVYYNSYDSVLTSGGSGNGGVIAIKPRSPTPVLALPNEAGKCHVCHEVSADGSSIWVQASTYSDGFSYDLNASSTTKRNYTGAANDRKFVWSAPYPDGSFALSSSYWAREAYLGGNAALFRKSDGGQLTTTGLSNVVTSAVTPAFSPDGRKVVFNFWEGAGTDTVSASGGHSLAIMDFSCGAATGSTTCAAAPKYEFQKIRQVYKDNGRWPGWPSFLPDGRAAVFHNTNKPGVGGNCADEAPKKDSRYNCQLTTWDQGTAELWIAKDGTAQNARRLDAANGNSPRIPIGTNHADDTVLNYQPTVNPVASGGYFWVVFTSRRLYGNLITGAPWSGGGIKKLWVAAIDINNPTSIDPSHPAFYLPGQEIAAGNSRGFWAVDPCKSNGSTCETGDECCNGFCRKDATSGALACQDKPPGNQCAQEFEKCTISADCCDARFSCIAGKCSRQEPVK